MYSNKLHELIDSVSKNKVNLFESQNQNYVIRSVCFLNYFESIAKKAVCFSHEIEDVPSVNLDSELIRLPFDVCWFEFSGSGFGRPVTAGFLCFEHENNGFEVSVFIKAENEWNHVGLFEVLRNFEFGKALIRSRFGKEGLSKNHQGIFRMFINYLTVLNCKNIRRREYKPEPSKQSVRKALGRQALFSTWTLELDLSRNAPASSENGGSHASPRIHLRRGHARQYAIGKWCWVQPCVVGNKELGVVHKDYATK